MSSNVIRVTGAREHNLKSVSVSIPKEKLVVITGPSGSGKSSLALDTLYAEGQRRYVESLSSYARQFLGVSKKPDVDKIEGLCPAIAIDQKTVGYNPRSTVGTITEIYDYLRVLFARAGTPHCHVCKNPVKAESAESIMRMVMSEFQGKQVMIAAPVAIQKKGVFKKEITKLFEEGWTRFMVDGQIKRVKELQDIESLGIKKTYKHTISVLVDSMLVEQDESVRLQEAIEKAFSIKAGLCVVLDEQGKEKRYSSSKVCLECLVSIPDLEPRLFSFNSPLGACLYCNGLGMEYDLAPSLWSETSKDDATSDYVHYEQPCSYCNGSRLKDEVLAVTIAGKNIFDFSSMPVGDLKNFCQTIKLSNERKEVAEPLLKEVCNRLSFLVNVGLNYLTLSRTARTLSGGEGQRIRLATQIGSALAGVLYILDEPSIGLHQRDNDRLIATLKHLRDQGNTVVVVEHDMDTIRAADYLIDMGPAAGILGGEVTAYGTPEEVAQNAKSLTGKYLTGKRKIVKPDKRRDPKSWITLHGARSNNLKNITVAFPVGVFCAVSGVSGSGKSTLVMQTLAHALRSFFHQGFLVGRGFDEIEGIEHINNMVMVDQSPIGRTPRSNPATYLGIFNDIRNLFAGLPESNARGYKCGRFSFNVAEGRCAECNGEGIIKVSMHFLEDVQVQCKTCNGRRYNRQTLEIIYKGKNIYDILEMSVLEAASFFDTFPRIKKRLDLLCEVGLDYLKLGQSSITLSGGEAQRIKLVNELAKRDRNTLYILDEPTTGLHSCDVEKLLHVIDKLVNRGNTALVIEHNLDVLKCVDYMIDIGPEGGLKGGEVIAHGTPEQVSKNIKSLTGGYLKSVL